jgi:hypothetical protein
MSESIRPNYSLRNTPEGLPGVLLEYAEDGTITRTPITSHSLREVFTVQDTTEVTQIDGQA